MLRLGAHQLLAMRVEDHAAVSATVDLARARGRAFDRLFIAGMIQHHEGAVAMARDEMEEGSDQLALELAADVAAGQQAEIGRMVDIRDQL